MAESKQTPREFLSEFIELYRSFPCLWLVKSKEYSDRNKKDLAYIDLVKKYQELDPSADRNTVVKKISALRTVYKKELSKVHKSEKSGTGLDDIYRPTLWYFDLLHFLNDQDSARPSRSTMSDADQETRQDDDSEPTGLPSSQQRDVALPTSGDDGSSTSQSVTPSPIVSRPKRRKNLTAADEVLQLAGEQLKGLRPEDEFDAYGKYVGHKLRSLKGAQAIFARKLINDVIFEGELDALTRDFKVINTRSFERRDNQEFNRQLYHQQPFPPPYIPPMHGPQLSQAHTPYPLQHNPRPSSSSNNILQPSNPAALYSETRNYETPKVSNMTLPNAPTNNSEQRYCEQPKTQQPQSQQLDSQEPTNSDFNSVNIITSQSVDNNVSAFFSNFSG